MLDGLGGLTESRVTCLRGEGRRTARETILATLPRFIDEDVRRVTDFLESNLNPKLRSGNEIGLLIHLRADGYNVPFRYSSPA